MPHETAVATDLSQLPPAAKAPRELIVVEDADLLTLFQSERDIGPAARQVPVAPESVNLDAESVKRVLAADARIDQLVNQLQSLEASCQRIATSVNDLERFVEAARQRLRTAAIETGAGLWIAQLQHGFAVVAPWVKSSLVRYKVVAVDFVRDRGVRHESRVTTHMTLRIALLLILVLAWGPLFGRRDNTDVQSAALSARPTVRDARDVDIVLAADQARSSVPDSKPMLTNVLATQVPAATSTRTRKRAPGFVGTLIVESKPPGAVVMVDQRKVGITPARLSQIPIGSHALWVVGNNHRRWTTAVTVRASGVTRIVAYLDRAD
jgi:PEGA domain-containing protein